MATAAHGQTPTPAVPVPPVAPVTPTRPPGEIRVASAKGDVFLAGSPPLRLVRGASVAQNQIVNTGPNSSVVLVFANGATVNLGADSQLVIDEFTQDPFTTPIKVSELTEEPTSSTTKLNLIRGELLSNVKTLHREKGSEFRVQTPVGAAGIRGTTFRIFYRPQGNRASFGLTMVEGLIRLALDGVTRPVDVAGNMEVVLPNIAIDPVTQVVKTVPAAGAPTSVSLTLQASLAESVQQAIGAASSVTFETTAPGVTTPPPSGTPPTSPDAKTSGEASATPGPAAPSALPAPGPTEAPARTSPGDGVR